jgi:DNA-binding MarR family transcriptional regulator
LHTTYPIVALLQAFEWFDESLQRGMKANGWPVMTRPESAVMIHVCLGMTRPSDLARSLGLTRQAIHSTINQITRKGIFMMEADPTDGRIKVIALTPMGETMRQQANAMVGEFSRHLSGVIGARRFSNMMDALGADWGEPFGAASPQPGGIGRNRIVRKTRATEA